MADHPSYPSVTTFQMCHDRLVCCRRTRRVLLIYPAGCSFLRCRLCLTCRCWQQSLSSLGSFSLTESVEKILTTSRRGKLVKIQKSSFKSGSRSPDERRWCCQAAHEGTNSSLSSFCAVHDLFLSRKNPTEKTSYHCFKKEDFGDALSIFWGAIFLLFPWIQSHISNSYKTF